MDPDRLRDLLESVAARRVPVDEAVRELRDLPFRALGFANADTHRHMRTGFPEVVLGEGKTPEQIAAILVELSKGGSTVLATRVSPEAAAVVLGAEEAALTAELAGNRVERLFDVGVAGLHRLVAHRELIERAEILIVVAGMEGALPSVVAGLFARPVIAVPTSVGYGASLGGIAALLAMLTSCAAGVSVVNIDNGFGAGQLAAMLNRKRET